MEFDESGLIGGRYVRRMFIVSQHLHSMAYALGGDNASEIERSFQRSIIDPTLMLNEDGIQLSDDYKAAFLVWPFYCANKDMAEVWPPKIRGKLERMKIITEALKVLTEQGRVPQENFNEIKDELRLTAEDLVIVKVHALQRLKLLEIHATNTAIGQESFDFLLNSTTEIIEWASSLCIEEHNDHVSGLNGALLETLYSIKEKFRSRGHSGNDLDGYEFN